MNKSALLYKKTKDYKRFNLSHLIQEGVNEIIIKRPFDGEVFSYIVRDGKPAYSNYRTFSKLVEAPEHKGQEFELVTWAEFKRLYDQYWQTSFKEISEEEYEKHFDYFAVRKQWLDSRIYGFFTGVPERSHIHNFYLYDHKLGKYFTARKNILLSEKDLLDSYYQF